jgi:hypothetical protein
MITNASITISFFYTLPTRNEGARKVQDSSTLLIIATLTMLRLLLAMQSFTKLYIVLHFSTVSSIRNQFGKKYGSLR